MKCNDRPTWKSWTWMPGVWMRGISKQGVSAHSISQASGWAPAMLLAVVLTVAAAAAARAEWQPKQATLMTRWANDATPEAVQSWDYPRPQLERDGWQNLNGLWDYAIRPKDEGTPESWDGKILVPFAVESALSGVMKTVGTDRQLWYRRTVEITPPADGRRQLLHFGAVDWYATVWLNGRQVGEHGGGYDPFTCDITEALSDSGQQELVVRVWDPTDQGFQPRGKQVVKPHGIWYTPVTGIWQTVWTEVVPSAYIGELELVPDVDNGTIGITVSAAGDGQDLQVEATARSGGEVVATASARADQRLTLTIPDARLWSPADPFLYDLEVKLQAPGAEQADSEQADIVQSYIGLRKIEVRQDEAGVARLFLNNEPVFQYGPLDQGWWPDGLYTAPSDEALRYDIEITKQLGFNMIRKHVKVEPARWYYWCDKLGMLVWQDMPNGDRHIGRNDDDIQRSPESTQQFQREWLAIIDALRNHPCIVMWVPFNEGWGQFDTERIVELTRKHDPTRLVNNASGWVDRGVGDVIDVHKYPGPESPAPEANRAAVLGEFGGLGLPLDGHTWLDKGNWGYRSFTSAEALTDAYLNLMTQLRPLIRSPGLAAAVYTQTTDVEIEVNGLMTYDRKVIKMPVEVISDANRELYLPLGEKQGSESQ